MPTQQEIDQQKELKGTYPNLQPEFRAMSTWEEFLGHPMVKDKHALIGHANHLFKMGVTFKSFKKTLNNPEKFAEMMEMKPKVYNAKR
jgi:hypothetical protein